ncbi:hypothetical protein BDR26DRAFT_886169 [Obelidium mucronatum]|nr:hypothetical protein BDR26DRAFT_886169 [Obelidium mucronatum]
MQRLPPEVQLLVRLQLPINGTLRLAALGLPHSALSGGLLSGVGLVRAHIAHGLARAGDDWRRFVAANGLGDAGAWAALPLAYQALLLAAALESECDSECAFAPSHEKAAAVASLLLALPARACQADALLVWTAAGGHWAAARLVLAQPGIDAGTRGCLALRAALKAGRLDIVRLLVEDHKQDAAMSHNLPLLIAVQSGHEELVRYLIKLDAVDPTDEHCRAVVAAVSNLDGRICRVLLQSNKIGPLLLLKICIQTFIAYLNAKVGPAFLFSFICFYFCSKS